MNHALTWVFALVTSTVSLLGATAHAQSSAEAPGATNVEIVLVGRAASDGSLGERIQSWFGPEASLSISKESSLAAERVLGPHPTGVSVWITVRTPGSARIYFAAAGEADEPTRYLVRDVPLNGGFDEVGSERVAQIVHSSVTALLDDSADVIARPDIERELAPPPPPVVAAPAKEPKPEPAPSKPTKPPSFAPIVGAFYRGAFAGDEGFAHGPGLLLGGGLDFGGLSAGAVGRGQAVLPHSEPFDELDITLTELTGRLGARGAVRTGLLTLDLELGGGSAWVRYDPEGAGSGALPAPPDTDQRYFWFASAGARYGVGHLDGGLRLELEMYPSLSHYELASGRELAVSSRFRTAVVFEVVLD